MSKSNIKLSVLCLVCSFSSIFACGSAGYKKPEILNSPLRFKMANIDGEMIDLESYKGNVVMIVNVASKCIFTPQYDALEVLYKKYKEQGFVILAFPANNFLLQEPGTNDEIKEFCKGTYGITFPLMSKISVAGINISPLYQYLTSEDTNPGFAGEIPWNFTKYLVNRKGKVVARFLPEVTPSDETIIKAIEKALSES